MFVTSHFFWMAVRGLGANEREAHQHWNNEEGIGTYFWRDTVLPDGQDHIFIIFERTIKRFLKLHSYFHHLSSLR